MARLFRGWELPLALLAAIGCADTVDPNVPAPISVAVVSGNGQTGPVGAELPAALVVRVTKTIGKYTIGVPLHLVNFRVVSGGGSVYAGSAMTDLLGMAREYWTLGPNAGPNVLEVRSVDPSSGEKRIYGQFTANGGVPGPEICNGGDDNFDGTVDDPSWRYCVGGAAAPNTDGMNACTGEYYDLNQAAADGCELRAAGAWDLQPDLTIACPDLLPFGGTVSATLHSFRIGIASPTQLTVTPRIDFNGFDFPFPGETVATVPVGGTFAWSTGPIPPIVIDLDPPLERATISSATGSIEGAFTGTTLVTTISVSLDAELETSPGIPFFGVTRNSHCSILNATTTASRVGGP